jgi:hypothetical protein
MSGTGGEKETLTDLEAKCAVLVEEMAEVLAECEGKSDVEKCNK